MNTSQNTWLLDVLQLNWVEPIEWEFEPIEWEFESIEFEPFDLNLIRDKFENNRETTVKQLQ